MSVINFPKVKKIRGKRISLATTEQKTKSKVFNTVRYRAAPWLARALLNLLFFILSSARTLLLALLMFLRPLVFFLITPLTTALIIAFVICLFTHPADTRLTWGFGLLTASALFTMFLYDWLIFKLGGTVVHITY